MQRRDFNLIDQKCRNLWVFELRRIWDNLGYFYNTLSAVLWYEVSVLRFWNLIQWTNIYCRCATSRFQFDRPKIVEITGGWNSRYFGIFMQHFVRGTFVWIICPKVLKPQTVNEYVLQMSTLRFQVDRSKMSKSRGLNLDEFDIFWDICTAQKDYAYIVMLWGLRCVDDYVRATVRERRCENDVVRRTLWGRCCEKDVVRKTLWERRWWKDVVRNSVWERYFFWPASFNRQNIRDGECFA